MKNLDAIDGTPVLDVKPVFKEFMPQNEIAQPNWVSDIMKPTGKNIQIKPTNFE